MIDIILNEWKAHTRNKVFVKLNIFFLITLLFVSWISIFQNASQDQKVQNSSVGIFNDTKIFSDRIIENFDNFHQENKV